MKITSVYTSTASSRRSASRDAFYDFINSLIFSFIKKAFAIVVGEFNIVDEFNNIIIEVSTLNFEETFKKFIFTPSSIMSNNIIDYPKTKFNEQQ